MTATTYPKRLIEVNLPIKDISIHARREKSIRHGHMSTLHLWWARRPLAACRAVLCASLWPDPADEDCPQSFRDAAANVLSDFAEKVQTDRQVAELCASHWTRWRSTDKSRFCANDPAAWLDMRHALLDFIADFANWDASSVVPFLEAARALTQAAHLTTGSHAPRPVVADPFAGGGTIPLEAIRIGADAIGLDLNPVAVILSKVLIEYVPRFGSQLADRVREWGVWVGRNAGKELSQLYPLTRDGRVPVAYLWARTIRCEGPACGRQVPLLRSSILGKRGSRQISFDVTRMDHADGPILVGTRPATGTIRLGKVACPWCGFTTPVERLREQLRVNRGGADTATLLCVVREAPSGGRGYEVPSTEDLLAVEQAQKQCRILAAEKPDLFPSEPTPPDGNGTLGGGYRTRKYGIERYDDFFTARQRLALVTLIKWLKRAAESAPKDELLEATITCVALAIDRMVNYSSSLCTWVPSGEFVGHTFGQGHSLPMRSDFAEVFPFSETTGGWAGAVEWVAKVCVQASRGLAFAGKSLLASADQSPLPDDSVSAIVTDPPYYDSVPYGELADFFYVWLKRGLGTLYPTLFSTTLVPKERECIVNLADQRPENGPRKDQTFFEKTMCQSLVEARRVVEPYGVCVIVFAHKSTAGWEAQLQAVIDAGWVVTGSWPIDTERSTRLRAMRSAALGSSVHIVCRPRSESSADSGAWRSVLAELPIRIHEWMPRLAEEGVVGADAIFACLGPALEIFSRYPRVEKASGEAVTLKDYLEEVWAAVAREALSIMFEGADASGLEEDARLTAMWLWTLGAGTSDSNGARTLAAEPDDEGGDDEEENGGAAKAAGGFLLEFDTARKIAQGLGAHLEKLADVVEVRGDKARLLTVSERAKWLFSKDANTTDETPTKGTTKTKPSKKQLGLFAEIEAAEKEGLLGSGGIPKVGKTTLDRVHQSMILFGAGRSEALKRFVVEDGVGKDGRFWKLAQSLSALYLSGSEEKRWVDGVLARKKSLGF